MNIIIFNLQLPTIKLHWERLRGRVRIHTVDKYTDVLTRLVTDTVEPQPLYVSVGHADFVSQWLDRLYRETGQIGGTEPRITRLIVKRLSDDAIGKLEEVGALSSGFGEKLASNLKTIRSNPGITRNRVEIQERFWIGLPPFHGYLFGDRLLIGPWSVDEAGHLHVQTPILETRRASTPSRHEWARTQFEEQR